MTTDQHDPSDPALAGWLREGEDDAPSAHIDAAILAAAHRAVERPTRKPALSRSVWTWMLPLGAAATVAAILVSVRPLTPTMEIQSRAGDTPTSATITPERPPDAKKSREQDPAAAPPAMSAEQATTLHAAAANLAAAPAAASKSTAAPPAATDAGAATSTARNAAATVPAAPAERRERAQPSEPTRQRAAALADATRADVARDDETRTADAWIERIRKLRRDGRTDEAAQELARFRAAFADADARLPADLRMLGSESTRPAAAPAAPASQPR